MTPPFEITDVDLSNPDIQRVLEVFGAKYEQKYKEVADLKKKNTAQAEKITAQAEEIAALNSRIQQLEEAMAKARPKGQGGGEDKNQRSYNARKFKGHIRAAKRSNSGEYVPYEGEDTTAAAGFRTVDRTADIKFCPVHGTPLSKTSNSYPRTTEDAGPDGAWRITEWTVLRRYCAVCGAQHSAPVWGVMPREHFGNNIIAQTCVMRSLVMSFETIQKIFLMVYGRLIHTSTLEELYDSAADRCRPLYDGILQEILDGDALGGDHTGWFLNGESYQTMVAVTRDAAFFHIGKTKARMAIEAILWEFEGIVISDSDSSWNSIGGLWQKCIVHYSRDIHRTLERNRGEEFRVFSHELRLIFRRAVYLHKKYDGDAVPENPVQRLQRRLDRLVTGEYTDADCKRYAKRLRREGTHLLTFLRHDVEFHNNASERALRLFARMRKTVYGSRSMRGLKNTETMATIYTTCEMRRVNPYHFLRDCLDGKLDAIPNPARDKKSAVIAAAVAAA